MSQENNSAENLVGTAAELVESYRNLIALKVTEHTSLGISFSVIGILSLMLAVFVFLFVGFGAAWWLGEYFQNMKVGFFIMGGVYTVMFGIIVATAEKIWIPKIRNLIIKKIYEQD
jgi:hypothetical protein